MTFRSIGIKKYSTIYRVPKTSKDKSKYGKERSNEIEVIFIDGGCNFALDINKSEIIKNVKILLKKERKIADNVILAFKGFIQISVCIIYFILNII
jgi:hypothetical protein